MSEDAGIEPRTVGTSALAVDALTTRQDLIHNHGIRIGEEGPLRFSAVVEFIHTSTPYNLIEVKPLHATVHKEAGKEVRGV